MAHGAINPDDEEPVSFAQRLAASDAFKAMFREGMTLVEEAAAYLDGPGREEARALARTESLAYAAESMRLTTRLMQFASWLLLQRAVNEGELTLDEAASEKRKVKLSCQESAASPEIFARLPQALRDWSANPCGCRRASSTSTNCSISSPTRPSPRRWRPVEEQLARLRAAFS